MLTDFQELGLTSRTGDLPKPSDIQTINVAKTCEKLRLAITLPRNDLQRTLDVTLKNQEKEITFRYASRIYYKTLQIHELQVNDLLNKSKMLVAQSGSWSLLKIPVKRRSSQKLYHSSLQTKRKRLQSSTLSIDSISFTDYTQLLDETENFVEWSKTAEVLNEKVSNLTTKSSGRRRTTCIHIREITINEVDAYTEGFWMDEDDDGFGNATTDELNTLMCLMKDNSVTEAKATKRKMNEITGICEKRPNNSDVCKIEGSHDVPEDTDIEIASVIKGTDYCSKSEHFSTVNWVNPAENIANNTDAENVLPNATVLTDINGNSTNKNGTNGIIRNGSIDELNTFGNNNLLSNNKQCCLKQGRKSKLKFTFDEHKELTEAEMRAQLQSQVDIRTKLLKMRAKVEWNKRALFSQSHKKFEKILPPANNLLSSLTRNFITMKKIKLKSKRVQTNSKTSPVPSSTYRNLLREILNREITEQLANEICSNSWQLEKNSRRRVQVDCTSPQQDENEFNQRPLVSNDEEVFYDFINNNSNYMVPVIEKMTDPNDKDECSEYDIMAKLLILWRKKNMIGKEINVENIIEPNKMFRKQAAKAFYALLKLAANGFIVLQTTQNSNQLESIQLGPSSAKLLQKSEKTCISLKRRQKGYRIHAN